jgi:alkaline phosphatase
MCTSRPTIALFLLATLLFAPSTGATLSTSEPGDANCDTEIKHDDIRELRRRLFVAVGDADCAGLDVNEDERLTAADLAAIVQPVVDNATRSIAVFIMSDGMGPVHVQAGNAAKGEPLGFTQFPVFVPSMDTSSLDTLEDGEPTDSAAGATAFATGVRVFNGEVSRRGDVDLVTLGELAAGAGKSVGIVTNSYLFDASPAAFIAHTAQRERIAELADQYLTFAPDVLIGAMPQSRSFRATLDEFLARARQRGYTVVRTAEELEALDLQQVHRLLALFDVDFDIGLDLLSRLVFPIMGTPRILRTPEAIDPPLARSAEIAVTLLARNPFGFFLFVENENTDTMSHAGLSAMLTTPTIGALVAGEVVEVGETADRVIGALADAGRDEDALIVVTADHETGDFQFPDDDPSAGTFPAAPDHTTTPVPLYATGPGQERFESVVDNIDVFSALRPAVR